jgi:hypothetical protein
VRRDRLAFNGPGPSAEEMSSMRATIVADETINTGDLPDWQVLMAL